MAASTISSQPFILSRITNNPSHPSLHHPLPSLFFLRRPPHRRPFLFATSCHHVDGDDVVSTRKSTFNRGFTVISKMLRRIKPLDNSVISKGVSEASKDSMKQTISTMLGLLPSDHFDVTVSFEIQPLHRLLVSSIITGYTLWNAEYRMSLTRNLEMSHADQGADCETPLESLEVKGGEEEHGETEKVVSDLGLANSEICSSSTGAGVFGDFPPQALKYIQQLQSELTNMKEELNAQKQEMMQLEHDRGIRNNLLEYLRSFDPDMVTEMSRPSSEEVEDIIHQLVQNILRRFLVDEASSNFMEQSVEGNIDDGDEFSDKIATSRDYLAKLLFCFDSGATLTSSLKQKTIAISTMLFQSIMDFLSNPFLFAAFSASLTLLLVQLLLRKLNNKSNSMKKKKKYHPVAGTVFNQMMNFNRLHHYMTDLARKYKTYRLLNPFRSEVYTSEPSNVEYILKTNFENYGKGLYNYQNLKDLLGDGIFAVDGEKWREQRKISSHEFSTKMLRDFSTSIFRKNAAKVANIVSETATSNSKLEIQDLLMKSTLDSIFQVAFGTELNSMCGSSEEGKNFANAFDTASALTLYRYVDVFWKIKKFLNIGSEATLRKNTEVLNEFVIKLINTRIQQMNSKGDSIRKSGDILSRFLQVKEYDTTYLRDIILNFVIAGKDTTAATLSWFMYMLCKYPAVQEKAAEEVREATNTKTVSSCTEFVSCVTDEALEKMNYLHATLTETLRLYPAVPVDAKICFADDTLPDGYSVKKGDMVSYQPYAMGRMKFIWGDDAEEFRPERWLDENGNFQAENPFKFTAFQAGPRICLGKEFAYRQMKIFSAVLLGCFRFKLNDEKRNVTYKTMINLHIDGGLEIKALHRD